MGIAERRLRQKEHVRESILKTAWQQVKEEGWQSLSIRKIADAIEYSVPVIYDHFENKEAILFELSLEGFRLMESRLEAVKAAVPDPVERIRALADAYWNFAFENKEYYQLMFGLGMPCCGAGQMKPEVNAFNDLIWEAITEVTTDRGSNMDDICFKTHALWSVIHGLISIMLMRTSDITNTMNKKVMDDTIAAFLKNL